MKEKTMVADTLAGIDVYKRQGVDGISLSGQKNTR